MPMDILTVGETARQLEISEGTVRVWADRGILPAMRTLGGQRLFQRADVIRVRDERRTAHGDEAA
jgi:excisionase family DNA binding protein